MLSGVLTPYWFELTPAAALKAGDSENGSVFVGPPAGPGIAPTATPHGSATPSGCGAVAVTPGRFKMSFCVSDSRMRKLASEKNRSASMFGLVTFSLTAGR